LTDKNCGMHSNRDAFKLTKQTDDGGRDRGPEGEVNGMKSIEKYEKNLGNESSVQPESGFSNDTAHDQLVVALESVDDENE